MNGHFTIKISREGKPLATFDFKNMILQTGYEYILNNTAPTNATSVINQCLLGNGTTEPRFTDTTLSGETVGTISLINTEKYFTNYYDSWTNGGYDDDILIHHHYFKTKATTFATITEIATAISDGVNAPILFSKTLLRDREGRPVTYNVGPGDDIDVTYTFMKKRDRVMAYGTTYTDTSGDSDRYGYTNSPLLGVRHELNLWNIGSLTESASKAGCTWSINFDTTRMGTEKKFDIIFNLEYVEGSAGYDAFYDTGSKPYFGFYYTIFNTRYSILAKTLTADQVTNGRKISIRQTFRIADIESWFGVSLLGFNERVSITSVGSRLDRGDHNLLTSDSYNYTSALLFKRYITPFTPMFARRGGASAAIYNGYIWHENMDAFNEFGLSRYRDIATNTDYIQFEKQPLALYCFSGTLGRNVTGIPERQGVFVNRLSLETSEDVSNEKTLYFVHIYSWSPGLLKPITVGGIDSDMQILVNGKRLRYYSGGYYNSGWYLSKDDVDIGNYDDLYGNTLPVNIGDNISIVIGESMISFSNPPHDGRRYERLARNTLNIFSETAKATVSLHSGFYGETTDE